MQFEGIPVVSKSAAVYPSGASWLQMPVRTECFICYTAVDPEAFKAHMFHFHGQTMPYICTICGKGYQSSTGLGHHKRLHEGKSFMCPVCDSKFTQMAAMKTHLKKLHDSLQCPHCMVVFKRGAEFDQHVLLCRR
ncbi:Zinc finger y-chromosomal protein [Plakobranchus ocellatus]|uniref:Zinc finger y-chromosomal protein n=1 Tax=Plakobranchus ocellatus TaxID=259542 RepID=A0AAV3ZC36_9GAST|nr:Zinc finger y-chromosomal protein [Plakobranchus ocellatus]